MTVTDLLKTVRVIACSVAAILCALLVAYFLGAFKAVATGHLLYDTERLLWWIFRVVISPICVTFTIICIAAKVHSLLEEPKKNFDERLDDLKTDSSWSYDRITDLLEADKKTTKRIQQLEAKVQVITSVLSLTRNEEQPAAKSNPLEDCR